MILAWLITFDLRYGHRIEQAVGCILLLFGISLFHCYCFPATVLSQDADTFVLTTNTVPLKVLLTCLLRVIPLRVKAHLAVARRDYLEAPIDREIVVDFFYRQGMRLAYGLLIFGTVALILSVNSQVSLNYVFAIVSLPFAVAYLPVYFIDFAVNAGKLEYSYAAVIAVTSTAGLHLAAVKKLLDW